MNVLVIGAAGFIGTNLVLELIKDKNNNITLVDKDFSTLKTFNVDEFNNIKAKEEYLTCKTDFDKLLKGQELIFYLASTIIPSNSNQNIPQNLMDNVVTATYFLESCVRNKVKKVVFTSSGGTVYGKSDYLPLKEEDSTNPISFYGTGKIMIEKLLYLYHYLYGIDYRVIRLSNLYGPYQRPDGILGAVTTFTYKALQNEEIVIYGDGSVIRDFIYVEDAIKAILKITKCESKHKIYNIGSGKGTSIKELLEIIKKSLNLELNVRYETGRKSDVPVNYLDISRYEEEYGQLVETSLEEGIQKTAKFLKKNWKN